MERFLWATDPNKPAGATGLQGYIIDTAKVVMWAIHVAEVLPQDAIHPAFYNPDPESISKEPGYYVMTMVRRVRELLDDNFKMANKAAHWWMAYMDSIDKPYTLHIDVQQINYFNVNPWYDPNRNT